MTLYQASDMNVSELNIVKSNKLTCIRDGVTSLEAQSKFITFCKHPLPNRKYVEELGSSITLSVPLDENILTCDKFFQLFLRIVSKEDIEQIFAN